MNHMPPTGLRIAAGLIGGVVFGYVLGGVSLTINGGVCGLVIGAAVEEYESFQTS